MTTDPSRQLTVDEAVGVFSTMVNDVLGEPLQGEPAQPGAAIAAAETPEEAETRRFLLAQHLIGLACPAPSACSDQRCRRDRTCRHLARARDRWSQRRSSHPRRPPGADVLRYAIWVYVSSRR